MLVRPTGSKKPQWQPQGGPRQPSSFPLKPVLQIAPQGPQNSGQEAPKKALGLQVPKGTYHRCLGVQVGSPSEPRSKGVIGEETPPVLELSRGHIG